MNKGSYKSTILGGVLTTAALLNGGCAHMPTRADGAKNQCLIVNEFQESPPTEEDYKKFFTSPDLTNKDLLTLSALGLHRTQQNLPVPVIFISSLQKAIDERQQKLPKMMRDAIGTNFYPSHFNHKLSCTSNDSPYYSANEIATSYWQSALLVFADNPFSIALNPPQVYSLGSKLQKDADRVKYGLEGYDATPDDKLYANYMSNMSTDILSPEQSTLFIHLAAKLVSQDPSYEQIKTPSAEDEKKYAMPGEPIIGVATIKTPTQIRIITYVKSDGSKDSLCFINGQRFDINNMSPEQVSAMMKVDYSKPLPITDNDAKLIGLDKSRIDAVAGYDDNTQKKWVLYQQPDGTYLGRIFENGVASDPIPGNFDSAELSERIKPHRRIERADNAINALLPQVLRSADWSRIDPKFMMGTKIGVQPLNYTVNHLAATMQAAQGR